MTIDEIVKIIKDKRDIIELNPTINDLKKIAYNPRNLVNMHEIVDTLGIHLRLDSEIVIFTDYDVDGIVGGFCLYDYLKSKGANVEVMVSNRKFGYGLSKQEIKKLKQKETDLVITVDCGISDNNHIKELEKFGMEVIVTDHHESSNPPDCLWVNPKVGNSYYERELSGAGVAYKLINAFEGEIVEKYLDLIAIANIADFVPLRGENRILTKLGLEKANKNPFPTLKEMMNEFDLDNLDENAVAYQIAPSINSVNRLGYSDLPLKILKGENVKQNTREMMLQNDKRKNEISQAIKNLEFDISHNIIIAKGDFKAGYTGLIASKLKDRYNRPCLVLNGDLRGSGRSMQPLNLIETLKKEEELFETVGGHELASGFKLKNKENLDKLKEFLYNYTEGLEYEYKEIDVELKDTRVLTERLLNRLDILRPFGSGNPAPLFKLKEKKLDNYKTIGKEDKHLQFTVDGKRGVWFFFNPRIELRGKLDITFELNRDTFRGQGVQLIAKGVQNESS